MFLETDRLLLRRFTEADLDDLVVLNSDPKVMRYLTGGKPVSSAVIHNETLPAILRAYDCGPLGCWATVDRSTAEFLGWLALEPTGNGGVAQAELGYRLRSSCWGKGYATEGSRALIRKGFVELGVQRVFAQTMAVNLASRRVMEKAGLRYARTFHPEWDTPIAGAEHGGVEYELHRTDWAERG